MATEVAGDGKHQIAEVTATFALLTSDSEPHAIIRVCRDLAQPRSFYASAFRHTLCRVKPSIAGGVADEDIALFHPLKSASRSTSERQALSAALAELAPRRKPRLAKRVRSVEFGPYACPGDAPWYFIADIFESLEKPAKFFPLVRRREIYRMKARASKARAGTTIDIVETSFEPANFTRTSAQAALTAIATHITTSFEPDAPDKRPLKHLQTLEIARGTAAFVAELYEDPKRKARFYSVFRRTAYELNEGCTNQPVSGVVETLEPALTMKKLASTAKIAAHKTIARAIERLPA